MPFVPGPPTENLGGQDGNPQQRSPVFQQSKLDAFMGKAVMDMGAAMHATLVVIGDKLGLYKAMVGAAG